MQEQNQLYEVIKDKSLKRLKFEDSDEDKKRLSTPNDPYYKQPLKYALSVYSYYMCFKCKKPYFGGRKACGGEQNKDDFNPKELICSEHFPPIPGVTECKTHGKEFVEYKCKQYQIIYYVTFFFVYRLAEEPCKHDYKHRTDVRAPRPQ